MEYRGNEIRVLDAARRRYPAGTRVCITRGRHAGELAVVESIDDATFHELGEVVVWVDRGRDGEYLPCPVMINELAPAIQPLSSRSRGVRKRGVTRTAPIVPASLSAS
jgi:hypothetical protein